MKNYKFGYARVSTEEQVLDRQIDMLSEYGVNQIYSEKMTERSVIVRSLKKCSTDYQREIRLL